MAAGLQHCWHLGPGSVGEEAEACRQAARLLGPHVGATRPHQEGLVVKCQALWPGRNCPLVLVFLQLGPVLTWAAARCTAKTLWTDGLSVASVWQGGGGSVGPGPWEVGYFRCVTFGAGGLQPVGGSRIPVCAVFGGALSPSFPHALAPAGPRGLGHIFSEQAVLEPQGRGEGAGGGTVGPAPSSWAGGLRSGRAPRGVGVSEGAAWLVAVGTHLRAFVRS